MSAKQDKHKAFAREYVANGGNATAAYETVYKCKHSTAKTNGRKLLSNADVALTIDSLTKKAAAKVTKAAADQQIESAQADDYAATLLAEAIETIRKIHTGEICDEQQEMDANGEWRTTRRTSRAADRQRAAEKLIEMYGETKAEPIKIELVGGAEEFAD